MNTSKVREPGSKAVPGMENRWWVYQRERFPILAHGPLVLAFSSSAVCFSHLLRGQRDWPAGSGLAVAFVTCLLFFLGLRIADEFKDIEEDTKYRSYRPVPRGLVTLRELGWLGVGAAIVQLGLAVSLAPRLIIILLAGWFYLALMSKEFFVRDWLKAHPITYLWTHMFIMPIVDLYATACDWVPSGESLPPPGLFWFLAASYCNGIVIEIGRKIRAPADEENGVLTYSFLWGRSVAVTVWLGMMLATAACATLAAGRIGFTLPVAAGTGMIFLLGLITGTNFLRSPGPGSGKRFELLAGVWTLVLYLSLGAIPLTWRLIFHR